MKRRHLHQSSRQAAALAALSLTGLLAGGTAHADNPLAGKADSVLAPKLLAHALRGSEPVILKTGGALTAAQEAQLRALGADITRHLSFINSVAATVPARNLAKVAALPFVTHLSSDGKVKKCDEFTVGSSGAGTAYTQYGLDGTGIGVAVVDSGVTGTKPTQTAHDVTDSITQTNARLVARVNFCSTDGAATDDCGHGTHVSGIIAGNGKASTGSQYYRTFYGIARNANLVSVKVLDQQGQGDVSSVISGIQWVVSNKSKYNIRVLNLSLGHPVGESYKTDPLCQAVEAAWKAGIVVVCAAGNNGRLSSLNTANATNEGWGTAYGSIASPGNDPYVITVGATKSMDGNRAHDRIATYSSRGPSRLDWILKPDIIAPGNRIISVDADNSYLDNYAGGTNDIPMSTYQTGGSSTMSGAYYCLSGTSMATPVVAGAAALLLQKYPNLTPDTVKARLMVSADKWTDPTGNADPCTYGAGYLNIPAALTCTATATQSALSPALTEDASGNVYLDASKIVSGSKAIWGSTGLTDLHVIWGTKAIWGSATLSASKAIYGTSAFADKSIYGTDTSDVDLSSVVINGE